MKKMKNLGKIKKNIKGWGENNLKIKNKYFISGEYMYIIRFLTFLLKNKNMLSIILQRML